MTEWDADLAASERRTRAGGETLFANAPALFAAFQGPKHVLTTANQAFIDAVGAERFRSGLSLLELMPEIRRQHFLDLMDKVYRSGEPHVEFGAQIYVAAEPGHPPQEAFLDFSMEPRRDETGAVTGIILLAVDITRLLQTERLAAGQRRLLEQIALDAPLPQVLDGMALLVEELLPGTLATVLVLEEDFPRLRHVSAPSLPGHFVTAVAESPLVPDPFLNERFVITDITEYPPVQNWRETSRRAGIRSCWGTPIMSGERSLGAIILYRDEPHEPDEDEFALGSIVARTAALAVERDGAVTARRAAQADLKFVLDVSTAVVSAFAYPGGLKHLARLAVPTLAPMCAVDILTEDDGRLVRVAAVADREEDERRLASYAPDPAARVLRTGQTEVSWDGPGYICMPLAGRDRTFGAITLVGTPDRPVTGRTADLAGELARTAVLGVDNARQHALLDRHLAAQQDLTERLALVAEITTVLTSTLEADEALRRLARLVVPRLADWAAVTLRIGDEVHQVAVEQRAGPSELPDGGEGPMPPVPERSADPLPRALREGAATLLGPAEIAAEPTSALQSAQHELFGRLGAASAIVVPLQTPRQILGALTVVRVGPDHPYGPDDLSLVSDIGRRAGLAVDNARLFDQQRNVAETMQRHLLTALPRVAGLELAARYIPAPEGARVGGDWYDAFVLTDGTLILTIGDVIGHDLQAAAQMAQLRNALRALAWDHRKPPSRIVGRLDSVMTNAFDTSMATLVVARVEGAGPFTLRWTSAGHPPPLLISHDGDTRYLEGGQGILLGLDHDEEDRPDHSDPMPPLSTLLLYTDGLVESVRTPLELGMARLRRNAASLAHRPPGDLCDALLTRAPPDGTDDIALLAMRVLHSGAARREGERRSREAAELSTGGRRERACSGELSTGP